MINTQTQIDSLIDLAVIQRTELKQLIESLPQLRDHLSSEIERNLEEIEPAIRSELEQFVAARALDTQAKTSAELSAKLDAMARNLESTTAAKYSVLMAERAENANLLAKAEARIEDAASMLSHAVKEIVTDELSRFPRAGEIDQLRKEFAEPRSLNPRGRWQVGETYNKLDLVSYNGDSYVSSTDGNREKPSRSSEAWTLSAARGNGGGGGGATSLTDLVPVPANGELLIGNGSAFVNNTLTAGTGVTITNGPGTITIDASGAQELLTASVVNAESVPITRGQVVYLFSATGFRPSVKLANNSADATSAKTFGVVSDNSIAANGIGTVTCIGVVDKLALGAYNDGDTVYLGDTAGTITTTKPYAPNHLVYVGIIERANNGNGELYVRIQNGYELDEIHDVQITSAPLAGALLMRDATNSLWKANRLTGTANQVTVTNADTAVTLSLPTTIANVNSVTAQTATNLTLTGGSTGASLVLGQGTTAGNARLIPTGTGVVYTGANAPSGDDSAFLVTRSTAGAGPHAFRDESAHNASANAGGYGAFDALYSAAGSSLYNHLAGFQARQDYAGSGTVGELRGFWSKVSHTGSGTVAAVKQINVANPSGAGVITNNYAIFIDDQTRGTSSNYAIYSIGSAPSLFAGQIRTNISENVNGATTTGGHLSLQGYGAAGKQLQIGYNTTGNYGWMQAANYGVSYSPIILNANGGNLLIGTTTDMSGSGGLKVAGTTAATSYITGAFQSVGGAGINGAVWADGTAGSTLTGQGLVVRGGNTTSSTNVAEFRIFGGTTASAAVAGDGSIRASANIAATNTTSGSVVVTGGVGVSGAGYFGGILNAAGTGTHTFGTTNTVTMAAGVLTVTSAASNGLIVRPANGNALAIFDASAGAADANAYFTLQTSGAPRWYFGQSISAASGDFEIYSVPLGASALKLAKTTGAATFAGAVSTTNSTASTGAGTGALQVAGGIYAGAASVFAGQLTAKGTATNDSAATGYIGEFVSASLAAGSAVTLANNTTANITSVSLTAGDWDVEANAFLDLTGATVTTKVVGISGTSATLGSLDSYSYQRATYTTITGADGAMSPTYRISIASTTTVYAVTQVGFSAGTVKIYGGIRARRVR